MAERVPAKGSTGGVERGVEGGDGRGSGSDGDEGCAGEASGAELRRRSREIQDRRGGNERDNEAEPARRRNDVHELGGGIGGAAIPVQRAGRCIGGYAGSE